MVGAFVFVLLAMGAGCTVPVAWEGEPKPLSSAPEITKSDSFRWTNVDEGVETLDTRVAASGVGARVLLWRFSSSTERTWTIATSTEAKLLGRWAEQERSAKMVLNAGYFHEDGLPSGWVFAGGAPWGKRRFSPEKSGIAMLGTHPKLLAGQTTTSRMRSDALQSFPWIFLEGKRAFLQETGNYARRTFLATDTAGTWYVGIVPQETVTLYQLGLLLEALPIAFERVLNLDGGPSTGVMTRFREQETRIDSFAPVSFVIVMR